MKSSLYLKTQVLPGNKIELQVPNLKVGQTIEVVILLPEVTSYSSIEEKTPSLEERRAFLKLPRAERRRILENQAEKLLEHYQQDSEWQELMLGDIIDY